jgi:hypothetical protein
MKAFLQSSFCVLCLLLLINFIFVDDVIAQSNSTNATTTTTILDTTPTPTTNAETPTTTETTTDSSTTEQVTTETTTPTITTVETTTSTTPTTTTPTTTTTTTTTRQPRGPSSAPLPVSALPLGLLRVEPALLVYWDDVVRICENYLRQQKPFVLPINKMPAHVKEWNFTVNASAVINEEYQGWIVQLYFIVYDEKNPRTIRFSTEDSTDFSTLAPGQVPNTTTTIAPSLAQTTTVPTSPSSKSTAAPPISATDLTKIEELKAVAFAMAQVLSDACNAKYYQPAIFHNNFLSCSGRPPPMSAEAYKSRNLLPPGRSLPIPRAARDPTNSENSTFIPDWAVVLGCIAAAMLGWAIGMLLAFAFCPKLPQISLRDRLLSDEDEVEQDFGKVFKDKIVAVFSGIFAKKEGKTSNDGNNNNGIKDLVSSDDQNQQQLDEQLLLPPPSVFPPKKIKNNNNNSFGKGNLAEL